MTMSGIARDVAAEDVDAENVSASDLRENEVHDLAETSGKGRTYGSGVDPLAAMLADADLGAPVEAEWHWGRKNLTFRIRSLSSEEFKRINERHTLRKKIGRGGQIHSEMDSEEYNISVACAGLISPNLGDRGVRQQLADKFKTSANDDRAILKRILLIGEIYALSQKILEITGFEDDEETVNELKDSSSGE